MYLGDILFEFGQIQLFNYCKCMSEKELFIYLFFHSHFAKTLIDF